MLAITSNHTSGIAAQPTRLALAPLLGVARTCTTRAGAHNKYEALAHTGEETGGETYAAKAPATMGNLIQKALQETSSRCRRRFATGSASSDWDTHERKSFIQASSHRAESCESRGCADMRDEWEKVVIMAGSRTRETVASVDRFASCTLVRTTAPGTSYLSAYADPKEHVNTGEQVVETADENGAVSWE